MYGEDYILDDDGVYYLTPQGKENAAEKAKKNRINSAIAANAGELATNKAEKEKTYSDNVKSLGTVWGNLIYNLNPLGDQQKDQEYENAFTDFLDIALTQKDYSGAQK